MIVDQKHMLGRTFVKLNGTVELVPVTDEPAGGYYSVTVKHSDLYYLGLMRIGDSIFDRWVLPSFAVWASQDARLSCPVELDADGTLIFRSRQENAKML